MNFSGRLSFQAGAALAFLAIGYTAGRFFSPGAPATDLPMSAGAPPLSSPAPKATTLPSKTATAGNDPADANDEWTATWARLSSQARSPAADEAAGAALQTLAEAHPARALAIALKERNRQRRTGWLHAVLRGWAAVAPNDAAAWLVTLPTAELEGAEGAVIEGASRSPAGAVALAQKLVQDNPAGARSHANQLLRVLSRSGDYEAGVDFAAHLSEQIRPEMLGTAFQYWAQAQPERAFDAAARLPAGDTRKIALDAAISGWAQGDPAGLADSAVNLSSAEDRAAVLQTALREWVQLNPKAASVWIDQFDPKPELDAGAASVALQPDVLAKHPEIAASWAESITSPELRSSTLANVLRDWAARDAVSALNYAKNSAVLQPSDRAALLDEFSAAPVPP